MDDKRYLVVIKDSSNSITVKRVRSNLEPNVLACINRPVNGQTNVIDESFKMVYCEFLHKIGPKPDDVSWLARLDEEAEAKEKEFAFKYNPKE